MHCLEEAELSSQIAKNSKEGNAVTSEFSKNTVFGTREDLGINVDALKTKKETGSDFLVEEL